MEDYWDLKIKLKKDAPFWVTEKTIYLRFNISSLSDKQRDESDTPSRDQGRGGIFRKP